MASSLNCFKKEKYTILFSKFSSSKLYKFEEQKIYENGQIEGGLSTFIEGELEDLEIFFGKTGD